jgi:hypothetical protein
MCLRPSRQSLCPKARAVKREREDEPETDAQKAARARKLTTSGPARMIDLTLD